MTFVFPRLNLCCCGCSLRIGVYIIAFINLSLFLFISVLEAKHTILRELNGFYVMSEVEFLESNFLSILLISEVTFSIYLIYANFKNNPSYMMPYILLKTTVAALMLMMFMFLIFMHVNGGFFLDDTLLTIAVFGFVFYSIVIVYSQYRNLKEGQISSS